MGFGMGIDAAIMAHIFKPLKYHFGRLAFDLAAIKELPELHPFPVEVQVMSEHGDAAMDWQGEAWQVIVSKTRSYGGTMDVAPEAYLDNSVLNLYIITAGNPIRSLEQAVSLLVRHELDDTTAKYFRGPHLSVRVPASIGMQMDGSVIKLEGYLRKAERDALKQTNDAGQVMVIYRFDAVPAALPMATSRTYNGALFKTASHEGHPGFRSPQQRGEQIATIQHNGKNAGEVQDEYQQRIDVLQKQGLRVTVVGVVPHPDKTGTYIIAGRYKKQDTDETEIVAIRVNERTLVLRQEGEQVPPATVQRLQEGEEIVVEGDKSKRGVIRARGVRYLQ
jgi:YegS C-terminal NAD kinase beta sandwich-like domain